MSIKLMSLGDLVEDFDIYPRHAIDTANVRSIEDAIRSGVEMPPIIVTKDGKRIVDGFHRKRAYVRVLGKDGEIKVDLRDYDSEAEIVKDAVRRNSGHGRKLDELDKTRSALMLRRLSVPDAQIAVVLHIEPSRLTKILVKVVEVKTEHGTLRTEPAKPVVRRFGNPRTLTPEQYKVHNSSSGWRSEQTITQLTREIESGVIDVDTPGMRERLTSLATAIQTALNRVSLGGV